jgi:chaperonin GroEL
VVLVEEAGGLETTLIVREGMYFERGYLTDRFITDQSQQVAVLENCHVLISAETIRTMYQLLPTMEIVARAGQSLLVIAPDVEAEALETLVVNCQKQTITSAAVKAPGHPSRPEILEDIAVSTGGVVVRFSAQLNEITAQKLGYAERVEVSKDSTWIVNGRSSEQMLRSRAAGIRQQISVSKNDREKEYLQERLAKLTGAVSVINVGGASTVDREERRYRIASAIHAVRSALTGGVVPGGGGSLWRAQLLALSDRGAALLTEALTAPIYAQIKNARLPVEGIVDELIKHQNDPEIGFDARELKVENLARARVLDPASIVKRQLQIAFGHARMVLQTGGWDVSRFFQKAPLQ